MPLIVSVLLFFLFIPGSYGIGRRLWRKCPLEDPLEEFVVCSGIGLGVYANVMFFLGLLSLLNRIFILILFIISILWSIKPFISFVIRVRFKSCFQELSLFTRICFLLFVMSALWLFLLCFNPELETDAFMYHISAPLSWLHDGAIRPIPFNMHSQFHFLLQNLNLLILALPAKTIASFKLIQWHFAVLFALSAYLLGKKALNRETGAAAMCAAFMSMEVSRVIRGAMIDVGVGYYVAMGFLCLTAAVREKCLYRYALTGIFYGLAFGSKNTGILFFCAALGAFVILPLFFPSAKKDINRKAILITISLVALIVLPWILKNAFFTGNPFYPFLKGVFNARMDYDLMANGFYDYYRGFRGFYAPLGMMSYLANHIPLFIHNVAYIGSNRMAVWLIFGILLLGLKRRGLDPVLGFMVIAGCFSTPLIVLTPFGRFAIGLYPLACALFCAGVRALVKSRRWAIFLFSLFIIFNARFFIRENVRAEAGDPVLRLKISRLFHADKERAFLCGVNFSENDIVIYMRENLTRENKALICVNHIILIRCPIPFIPNPHMHTPNLLRLSLLRESEEDVISRLDSWGVTHLIISDRETEGIREFIERNFTPLVITRQLVLYEKRSEGG